MSATNSSEDLTERATFSMACFWAPDGLFGCTRGVMRTKVGYTGGTTKNPTYNNLGDHTETVQVDYNPKQTNYEKLLGVFWRNHHPHDKNSRQYMSAIFYHDENQEKLANSTKQEFEENSKQKVTTKILPAQTFYDAEEYHQKYHLKQHPKLLEGLRLDLEEMTDSFVCARLNGYVAGFGNANDFEKEWPQLGISQDMANYVMKVAKFGRVGGCNV